MSTHAIIFDLDTLVNRKQAFEVYTEKLVDTFLKKLNAAERREVVHFMHSMERH